MLVQLNIFFIGTKEVVDFKYYAQMNANKFLLNGSYQELGKKWFHIKVEGKPEEVNAFADSFLKFSIKKYITDLRREERPVENFTDFVILAKSDKHPDFAISPKPNFFQRLIELFNSKQSPSIG